MVNTENEHKRQAVSWACATIARYAPHLQLVSIPGGWHVTWDDGTIHDVGENLDWRGLCAFARGCIPKA